ncbi:MAG: SDR family NAD(P)-dependent oxidoreductase [Limnobacter sp.]|jgi:short-subunit dehydrogenase|uniref:SDR family NAD(P)-dependent oxidoreductase n=1 Tax=Limnobacter sp. TaxID=2003368 RepID=UPI00391889B2
MNKTALITGASSGIGKALALEMAKRGYNLALTARREDKLNELKQQIHEANPALRVETARLDVNDTASVDPVLSQLMGSFTKVDIVVVNAGINSLTKVGKDELEAELGIIQTNINGAIATVHAATKYFRAQGGGHVVGISSLASLNPIPKQAAYCATKAAFSMYMECAAIELARHNIVFTQILPGFVKTEIVDNMEQFPFLVSAEQAAREMANHIEHKKAVGVVPGYPWRFIKPFMGKMPRGIWKMLKV